MQLSLKEKFTCGESGFTLVELLAAIVIMSVIMAPMVSAYIFGWKTSKEAFRRTTALMLARWKMSQLRSEENFSSISTQDKTNCDLPPPYDADDGQESIYVEYNCTVTVTEQEGVDPNFAAKKVDLKIYFDSLLQGGERTIFCGDANDCPTPDFSTFFAKMSKN